MATLSCKKDQGNAGIPAGTWIDQARPQDSLIVYRENGKNILFDKSQTYRDARPRPTSDDFYKWVYKLQPGKIQLRFYTQSAEEYQTWEFAWTEEGKAFSLQANAIRPYLSSIGTRLVYRKVQ